MNRRTFGLAVRLLAVVAAIYAFFSLRSQVAHQQQRSKAPIQVKVVPQNVCGWVAAQKSSSATKDQVPVDNNPSLRKAIERPEEKIAVSDPAECNRLVKLSGSVVTTDKGSFKIEFLTQSYRVTEK